MRYLHRFLSKATPVFTPGAASKLGCASTFPEWEMERLRDKKQSEMAQESHSGVWQQTAKTLGGVATKSQCLV